MMRKTIIGLFVLLGYLSTVVHAQNVYTINLAENEGDTLIETDIKPGEIEIQLFNQIPGKEYLVNTKFKRVDYSILDFVSALKNEKKIKQDSLLGAYLPLTQPQCINDSLITSIKEFGTLDDESEVPASLVKLNVALKDTLTNCTSQVTQAELLKQATKARRDTITIKNNHDTFVVVERIAEDGTLKQWIVKFKSKRKGEWRTMYGFNFAFNVWKNDSFYSHQTDTVFTISKSDNNELINYLPSVYFVWQPYREKTKIKGVVTGFMAGLGIEDNNPAITTGLIFTIRDNIGITLGATIHQQQFLKGQYSEGQIIKESLTEDQLHENAYRINPSFSVAFRFNNSPFKSD